MDTFFQCEIVSSFITWLLRTEVRAKARVGRDKRRFILKTINITVCAIIICVLSTGRIYSQILMDGAPQIMCFYWGSLYCGGTAILSGDVSSISCLLLKSADPVAESR
mgnify:CR=1 FL=1